MTVQEAEVTDLPQILSLCKEAAISMQSKGIDHWQYWLNPPPDKLAWTKQGLAQRQYHFVFEQEELVGMYRLQFSDELYWGQQDVTAGYVHALVVRQEFKGQGWGPVFLKYIEEQLRLDNIYRLRLDCNGDNQFLCTYYEQEGFSQVGIKQMPHSRNVLYEKLLS